MPVDLLPLKVFVPVNDVLDDRKTRPLPMMTLAIKDPKIVIPAQAGISSRTVGVYQKIPASAGMTVVCLFSCPIDIAATHTMMRRSHFKIRKWPVYKTRPLPCDLLFHGLLELFIRGFRLFFSESFLFRCKSLSFNRALFRFLGTVDGFIGL